MHFFLFILFYYKILTKKKKWPHTAQHGRDWGSLIVSASSRGRVTLYARSVDCIGYFTLNTKNNHLIQLWKISRLYNLTRFCNIPSAFEFIRVYRYSHIPTASFTETQRLLHFESSADTKVTKRWVGDEYFLMVRERGKEREREREMDGNFLMEIKQVLNVTDSLANYKTCALINPSMCYNYKNSCLVSKAFLTCMVSY